MTNVPPNYDETDFPALDCPNNNINNISTSSATSSSASKSGSTNVGTHNKQTTNNNNNNNTHSNRIAKSWSNFSHHQTQPTNTTSTNNSVQQDKLNLFLLNPDSQQIQQLLHQQQQQQQHQSQAHQQQQHQQQLHQDQQQQHYQQQQQQQHHQQQKQHIPQQLSNQQVPDHLVEQHHTEFNSNNMVPQYHMQQQPQQPQPTLISNNITNNTSSSSNSNHSNILSNHNVMQNNTSTNIINNNNNINSNSTVQHHQQQQKRAGLPNPIISSERCCTFKITPEERRHRDFELEQSKILKEIMQKTNTKIEVTTTKDGALNFCIIGKESLTQKAKNLVLNDFQATVTLTVRVPKTLHGRLLGPKGQRLSSIQDDTQTKIAIPRKEEDSDMIKVVGLKSNAQLAIDQIQRYVREFAGKTVEKVNVERIYLLFVTGPFNENLKRWEEMGCKVSTSGGFMPSQNERESSNANDEITFTIIGEATLVGQIKDEITQIYEDKKRKCTTVNIEVKKAQHKYILGPGGQNLRNLFAKTNVSIELPQENESETITLRGERSKLGPALLELYEQAHSETDEYFEVENWLHKYLIGPRKSIFKACGVEVKSLEDKIKLHGPPGEVENMRDLLESELKNIRRTIIRKDIRVEPRIHGYIIGKSGATVDQIREESNAYVLVPKNDESSELITLEGTEEAVAIAEEKIYSIARKYEASKKMVIDQQLHGSIIGRGGEKIRSIREKFSQVVFTFPEQGSRENEIGILGPTEEVEECYKYLDELHKQLQESNHQVKVTIKKDVIKYLPDAQPAIKRIKADHRVKIDIIIGSGAASSADSKEPKDSDKAKESSQNNNNNKNKQQQDKANKDNNKDEASNVDSKKNNNKSNNKNKGKQQAEKQSDNKNNKSNGVADKDKNKSSSNDSKSNDKKPANNESYALVIGKKEDVEPAKTKLIKLLDELATTIEIEVPISHKLRSLMGPKTKLYQSLLTEFQNKIVISFPPAPRQERKERGADKAPEDKADKDANKSEQTSEQLANGKPAGGKKDKKGGAGANKVGTTEEAQAADRTDIVKIRGPKAIARKAEKNFESLVQECQEKLDKSYSTTVTVETAIIEKFVYADKMKLNKIRESLGVKLNIPDKRDSFQLNCQIVGYEKNVNEAVQQFKSLVQDVEERAEETIEIPSQFHPRLIGAQGRVVKKIMEDYKVGVKFARPGEVDPNAVVLSGRPKSILAAKTHMLKMASQFSKNARQQEINGAGQDAQESDSQQQQESTGVDVNGTD